MRAIQIVELSGPGGAASSLTSRSPTATASSSTSVPPGSPSPRCCSRAGQYQLKPDLPFVPGSEVAGVVRADSGRFKAGDRVAAFCLLGGFAETALAQPHFTFPLADALDFAQGAGLILNYHTAYFSLVNRGRLRGGRDRARARRGGRRRDGLAAGGARASARARSRSCRATRRSGSRARRARTRCCAPTARGRTRRRRSAAPTWSSTRSAATASRTRCARSTPTGALVVVGFTGGSIPEVKVNRLLLNNVDVVGAGWGAYITKRPEVIGEVAAALDGLIAAGHVRPVVGARLPLEQATEALELIDGRGATGKVVLEP